MQHMMIGYARVSREDEQDPQYQHDALTAAGCVQVFEDRMSGDKWDRAGLEAALTAVGPGDALIVWKLDRFGRTMREAVNLILDLEERGVAFRSLTESLDTKTPLGRGVIALLASVAEDELVKFRARTKAGMAAVKRRGKHVGRPAALTPEKRDMALRLLSEGKGKAITARMIGVDPATLRRHLNQYQKEALR